MAKPYGSGMLIRIKHPNEKSVGFNFHTKAAHPHAPKTSGFGKHMIAKWFLVALPTLVSCDAFSMSKHSEDRAALLKFVKLDLPINTVRWEVFSTPESTGLAPGPTDNVTLIAEISPAIPVAETNTAETAWITPGAALHGCLPVEEHCSRNTAIHRRCHTVPETVRHAKPSLQNRREGAGVSLQWQSQLNRLSDTVQLLQLSELPSSS